MQPQTRVYILLLALALALDSRELFAIYRWIDGTGDYELITDDTDRFAASPNRSRIAKRLGPIDRVGPMEPVRPPALEIRIVTPGRRIPTTRTSVLMGTDHSQLRLTADTAADTAADTGPNADCRVD